MNKNKLYIQGAVKNSNPSKIFTWFIMATNNENVNKSLIFAVLWEAVCDMKAIVS